MAYSALPVLPKVGAIPVCRPEQGRAHCGLGEVHCGLGDPVAAREHWERALACYAGECVPGATRVRNHLAALDRVVG